MLTIRDSFQTALGEAFSQFRITDRVEGRHAQLVCRFVQYDYVVVVVSYDRGLIGFGVDAGGTIIILAEKQHSLGEFDGFDDAARRVDRAIRYRIPQEYLQAFPDGTRWAE